MFTTKMRIRLYRSKIWCQSLSSQHTVLGCYQPARETAFKCCFAGGPIVAHLKEPLLTKTEQTALLNRLIWIFNYSFWHANSGSQNISLIVCIHFRPPYLVVTSKNLLKSWSDELPLIARQLGNPRAKSSLSRSACENNIELKLSIWLIYVKK